jgi:hypothetical protein
VTLVEFGDYECPFCAAADPVVKAIAVQAGDAIRFVFRHFPLTTMHPHAELANEAATAGRRRRTEHTRLGQLGLREAPDRASRQLVQKRAVGGGLIDQRLVKQG